MDWRDEIGNGPSVAIPATDDPLVAAGAVMSVVRNVSAPYGVHVSEEPNISSTRWGTVSDHKSVRRSDSQKDRALRQRSCPATVGLRAAVC